jgi:hypothetical protein
VSTVRRLIFVVSPGQRKLYESLRRTFASDGGVEVVLDRRRSERRRSGDHAGTDRRRSERRRRRDVEAQLAARGYAVVGIVALKHAAR